MGRCHPSHQSLQCHSEAQHLAQHRHTQDRQDTGAVHSHSTEAENMQEAAATVRHMQEAAAFQLAGAPAGKQQQQRHHASLRAAAAHHCA